MRMQISVRRCLVRGRICASQIPRWKVLFHFLLLCIFAVAPSCAQSQSDSAAAKPYATLDRQSVAYRGPIRSAESDLPAGPAVVGMILPLKGSQQPEGKALLAAAQLAIEEERAAGPLPGGRELQLAVRDESGPWGQASAEILRLFEDDHALAVITSANGTSAHLAEQIANKISIPILTLASDPTTTQANVPWLFRLGPSDADQARAFCRHIYADLGLKNVLLVAEADHDGRIGGEEFEKATKEFRVQPPLRFEWTDSTASLDSFRETLQTKKPDAIVVWADAPAADKLLEIVRATQPAALIFLCSKAAQLENEGGVSLPANQAESFERPFAVNSSGSKQIKEREKFEQVFLAKTGMNPGLAAFETYEAVRLLSAAIRHTGANRVLLRDYLANEERPAGAEDNTPFDPAGNSLRTFALIRLQSENLAKP